jgi:hypothetical protein
VSCAAPGDCAVTGYVNNGSEFVDDESDGTWGTAQLVAGYNSLNNSLPVISCAAPGDCVVAGSDTSSSNAEITSVATESNGVWGSVAPLPGVAAAGGSVTSLSCPAVGQCAAGGSIPAGKNQLPFVASESDGTWSSQEVPGYAGLEPSPIAGGAGVDAVSCAAPGECTAGGSYQASASDTGVFAVSESGGVWQAAQEIPDLVPTQVSSHFDLGVAGISCPAAGDCSAVINNSTTSAPYVADETSGKWAAADPVAGLSGPATVNAVSCPAPGACLAGGQDGEGLNADGLGNLISEDWVLQRSTAATATSAALSTAQLTYGDEQAEKVTATVRATTPAPTGTITVTAGGTALCTIKLASGTGSCTLPVAGLAPGKATLNAHYAGGPGFGPSVGISKQLTVAKAGSSTILKLSPTRVAYGHEQQEKLSVRVIPQHAGRPSGTVTMLWRGVTLCVIRISQDIGACTLSSKRLGPGAYNVVARYGGDRNFNGSSAKETLTITG